MVASSLDAREIKAIQNSSSPNDENYVQALDSQLFKQGMSFSGNERDKLWLNRGADGFSDLSDMSGADSPNDGRAVIAADFDDDGDVDLFVHEIQRERHGLYRNDAQTPGQSTTHFLKLRLRATSSQHEAIGAQVLVRGPHGVTNQVLARGAGFASCQAPELVFGLAAADSAEVEVIWPGAKRESFGTLAANSRALLVEGSGKPQLLAAAPRPLPNPLPPGWKLDVGDALPKLGLADAQGREVELDARELAGGKRLYLNFWASWCPPCVAEIPTLQALADQGEVRVVAIGLDLPRDRVKARTLMHERGGRFPTFYLPEPSAKPDSGLAAIADLERLPIPATLIVSPDGRIEEIVRGAITDTKRR